MNWIKNLRTNTGLSQTKLCTLLHVPKSTLAMAETGQRQLPNSPHLKLTQLYVATLDPAIQAAAAAQATAPPAAWQLEALHKKISHEIDEMRFKAAGLKRRLEAWENRQAERVQMRLLLTALTHLHDSSTASESEARWLQRRQEELQEQETRENIFEQQYLQLQLDMLETAAGKLEALASSMKFD